MRVYPILFPMMFSMTGAVFAQQVPPPPELPAAPQGNPATAIVPGASAIPLANRIPVTGKVDEVLERIQKLIENSPESDAVMEQTITRQMNLLQSTDRALRPVGYVSIGKTKYILISRDGKTITRLHEGSSLGPIKVVSINENGVSYKIGEKTLFSPLSLQPSEPPKPPEKPQMEVGQGIDSTQQGPVGNRGNSR